jgi:hypothetical protein
MRKLHAAALSTIIALSCALTMSTPVQAAAPATVKIINHSKWDIHHMFLSPHKDEDDWGPDQLGEQVIAQGETFTLKGIPCDHYDIRIVDEDGDECVIANVSMCGDASNWTITDKELLDCENDSAD